MLYVCLLWGRIEIITFVYLNSVWMKAAARKLRPETAEELRTNIQDLEHKPQSQYKAISMCYVVIYLETTHCRLLL